MTLEFEKNVRFCPFFRVARINFAAQSAPRPVQGDKLYEAGARVRVRIRRCVVRACARKNFITLSSSKWVSEVCLMYT